MLVGMSLICPVLKVLVHHRLGVDGREGYKQHGTQQSQA